MESIKVMADYDCYPLWGVGPGFYDNLSPYASALGLSSGLAVELDRWAEEYDATLNRADPKESGFPTPEAEDDFARRGRELAQRVANEVGGVWSVIYFDSRELRAVTIS
ncbi:hypothetical protein J4H86_06590 [Spiractinospora alimapuensis]|uniref:hypothetical protein n=1 Tax=Spiractinospora alimapuensis TaxID=2820884 RepID=UPI001F29481C|nr:hypothetical protein [Spiractinospora alimapuensis]QVQ53421.1 hypothetical protein J4H86_06590 [Spiractinospora alimapuensis]